MGEVVLVLQTMPITETLLGHQTGHKSLCVPLKYANSRSIQPQTIFSFCHAVLQPSNSIQNHCYALKCRKVFLLGLHIVNVVVLLFYVHDRHLWSCQDGQLT